MKTRYYFEIEHIAEKEMVKFCIDATNLQEAIKLATSLNPGATYITEQVELESDEDEITNF